MNGKMKITSLVLGALLSLTSLAAFSGCDLLNSSSSGEPAVSAHEHTFATTWSSNEGGHYHTASCEHTDLVSGLAAHTYGEDGKCTVCTFEKPVAETSVVTSCKYEDHQKCPTCGACIETRCDDVNAVRCGESRFHEYVFEAEFAEIVNKGQWRPSVSCIPYHSESIAYTEQYCTYVRGLNDNVGAQMRWTIVVDKACTVTLKLRASGSNSQRFFDKMSILVNDEFIDMDGPLLLHEGRTDQRPENSFNEYNFGCIELQAGENVIDFVTGDVSGDYGVNIDYLKICSSEQLTCSWTPIDWREKVAEYTEDTPEEEMIYKVDWDYISEW